MKKILLIASACLLFIAASSCSSPTEWSEVQRAEFINSLDPYRQMVYLNEMSDPEFVLFTTDLGTDVESSYPVYTRFIVMPSLSDSLDLWVVSAIVEELNTDAENMRYLYPYHTLVAQEILPAGMDHQARREFYSCLSQKVNAHFTSLESFFSAVMTNALDPNVISDMQSECSAALYAL